ncbi:alternate F1F0 ATPase, F1 subunit alpha [Limibaculum sp. M0105]|uniref:ATP synthase subunit alpha n=1 Tax=Thermohalobaculum xanthum TaxID=2753746 RepID=A0A8J7M8G1_9RHOB|nr:alternate F1F0 ATPase, F1 subunit alpha [Thermohalobaculum xanthum]MBK0399534.1 alternate F1F0 ATPase, F1 subunit alpha [Thermohalobaculum xanthum]
MADRLSTLARRFGEAISTASAQTPKGPAVREIGTVTSVGDAVAHVSGLRGVVADELIALPGDLMGIAASLSEERIGLILLGPSEGLTVGAEARRTGRVVDVPVGEAYLGRIVDALGRPLDGGGPIRCRRRQTIERDAPKIMDRRPVNVPLQTGIKAVDATVPIGRGQRELIVGDRQTGKTAVAIDAILNQADSGVVSIYCAIGQRGAAVRRVAERLREHGALGRTIIVVASGEDPPGLQFVAPYAATAIAEHFMRSGRDALIVYDDLTRHARAYRELSLLLRRPPGREAFPGDIFYVHARLLERATQLRDELGGGSMTALPIVETEAGNLSAYIPTNLISITDGQIYLSPELFRKGLMPAIDIGLSVSRVGGDAQLPAYRAVAGDLKLAYSQFEELEAFARFGSRLDEDTRHQLERGRRVRQVLRQDENQPVPLLEQIAVLLATTAGVLDEVPVSRVRAAEAAIRKRVREDCSDLGEHFASGGKVGASEREAILSAARAAIQDVPGGD